MKHQAEAGDTETSEGASSWFGPPADMPGPWKADAESGSFTRLWGVFMFARVAVAAGLLVLQAVIFALGNVPNVWSGAVGIAYLFATIAVRLWATPRPPRGTFDAQWVYTIGVDVVAFSLLNILQSTGINYTPLFALPVLLASILGPLLLALGTAASVTLLLLLEVWWASLQYTGDMTSRFVQAALSGTGFFVVALLANQLAFRLVREEQLARASQSVARMQTQVNELVIESLSDGVLVIDANGVVRSANPASRRLLATRDSMRAAPFVLATEMSWQPLAEIMQDTFAMRSGQETDVRLEYPAREARRLHVRTRLTASHDASGESLCVMFLEDLREMEARIRTEKMAAMGRMSAAVAHEIRNPLAAISQANALLEEDLHDPAHRRLTAMVSQNAQRLAKIVDEVLDISRAKAPSPDQLAPTLELDDTVTRIAGDWARQNASTQSLHIATQAAGAAVVFDPEHLRRIMINLLDNALRYASPASGSIEVSTQIPLSGHARLAVWSDGAPLEKTVQRHLFEPFFSSESRSSGLGLYICRELCERYGAVIGYQRVTRGETNGNEFFVVFRPSAMAPLAQPSFF
ncbi:MAG: histidine kinase dimerization/phospho-acceptor domain-containing protein [Polaromonas sp.]|nr:histidine kinase dimerization/phospho-acceptor domain-containing protein [Polaromonas sp.]